MDDSSKDLVIVLPDLEKKNDEALHDALVFFEKKCPYCLDELFKGSIRNKIDIDHYIAIKKGGQNVPWNVLPVCSSCNKKKNAKTPKNFLEEKRRIICENYLQTVKAKYVGRLQDEVEKFNLLKRMLENEFPTKRIPAKEEQNLLKKIFDVLKMDYDFEKINLNNISKKKEIALIEKHYRTYDGDETDGNNIIFFSASDIAKDLQKKYSGIKLSNVLIGRALSKLNFKRVQKFDGQFARYGYWVSLIEDEATNKEKQIDASAA